MFSSVWDDIRNFYYSQKVMARILAVVLIYFISHIILSLSDFNLGPLSSGSLLVYENSVFSMIRKPWAVLLLPVASHTIWAYASGSVFIYLFFNRLASFLGTKNTIKGVCFAIYLGAVLNLVFTFSAQKFLAWPHTGFYSSGINLSILSLCFMLLAFVPTAEYYFFRFKIKFVYIAFLVLVLEILFHLDFVLQILLTAGFAYFFKTILYSDFSTVFVRRNRNRGEQAHSYSKPESNLRTKKSYYPTEEEINFLLDKINKKGGYDALSPEEKERLKRASEKQD
jgi:hypothetical protein